MDAWHCIERARNVGEATLLQRALQAEGIATRVLGEHRASIAGYLPMAEAELEVHVPATEVERARTVLEALRKADPVEPWKCSECGEENPGNFDECWKCSREAEPAPAPEGKTNVEPRKIPGYAPALLAVVIIGVTAFISYRHGQNSVPMGSALTYGAWGADGCIEERFKAGSTLVTVWCDRDANGVPEYSATYSLAGMKTMEWLDADQNGVSETVRHLDGAGKATVEQLDDDQDGRADRRIEYAPEGKLIWYDDDHDGRFERHEP